MKNFRFLVIFFIIAVEGSVHVCQHHQNDVQTVTVPLKKVKTSKATTEAYQPIRFGKHVFDMPSVQPSTMAVLNRLFDETIEWMSSYLKVIPFDAPIQVRVPSQFMDNYEVPADHRSPGIPNIDYMLYFIEDGCNSIANAQFLQQSDTKQPYVGLVRVCKNSIDVSNELYYKTVLLHEITHAIGFSDSIFQIMKDSTGVNYLKIKQTSDGVNRKILTSPKVTSFIKDQFDCNSLEGAYLENDGGGGTAGSHWEITSYSYELMVGWINSEKVNKLTNLTLNFLEDTGWYKVDYSYANKLVFGYKKGCEMAELKCSKTVNNNEVVAIGDYCIETQENEAECTFNYDAVGFCQKPTGYDCPIIHPYGNRMCINVENRDPDNKDIPSGIEYGNGSFCHMNYLLMNGYVYQDILKISCLKTKCNAEDNSYSIYLCTKSEGCYGSSNMNDYVNVKCTRKGEVVTVNGFHGSITCNDPDLVCNSDNSNSSGGGGGLDEDDDDDNTGTDRDDGVITRRPTIGPPPTASPITVTPSDVDDRSSGDFVVCIVVLLSIVFMVM